MLAQLILRIGMAIVFFWHGIEKVLTPDAWVGQLPLLGTVSNVYTLGALEIIIGMLFLTRLFKLAGLGAAVLLGGSILVLGFSPLAIRDIGLFFAAVSLALPWEKHLSTSTLVSRYHKMFSGKR